MKPLRFGPRPLLFVGTLLLCGACSSAAAKPAATPPPPHPTPLAVQAVATVPSASPVTTPPQARASATPVQETATPAEPTTATVAAEDATPVATGPAPAATAPGCGELGRLIVPAIGIDAGFVTLGLLPGTRQMDSPKTKDAVGCYLLDGVDGSNLVLGGHVDWFTREPGVFWDLRKLQPGDEAQIVLHDGTSVRFRVTTSEVYEAKTPAVGEIIGDTPVPTLTLITCDGEFNPISGEYDKSRIVRAEKIDQ